MTKGMEQDDLGWLCSTAGEGGAEKRGQSRVTKGEGMMTKGDHTALMARAGQRRGGRGRVTEGCQEQGRVTKGVRVGGRLRAAKTMRGRAHSIIPPNPET